MALTPKMRVFVAEFAKDRNITRSAKAAGYSKKTAYSIGQRLMKNVEVATAIEKTLQRVEQRAELSAADVLAEIRKLAFCDMTLAFKDDGSLLPFTEMPEDVRKSIGGAETIELFAGRGAARVQIGHARKVKAADKVRALELLAKHFKLLTDVMQHQGVDGAPLVLLTMPANGSEAQPVKTETEEEPDGASGS